MSQKSTESVSIDVPESPDEERSHSSQDAILSLSR